MAAKQSTMSKAAVVIFTSIVAPVIVNVTVTRMKDSEEKPAHSDPAIVTQESEAPPVQLARPLPGVVPKPEPPLPVETTQVVVQGVGRSSDEALRAALGLALHRAVASQVDPESWSRHGHAILADVGQDRTLILGWKDLGTDKEWKLQGTIYRKEVAVEVDRTALKERVRAASSPVRNASPLVWQPSKPGG